jgi:hypothetical protein
MPPAPMVYDGIASLRPLFVRAFEAEDAGEWRLVPARLNRMPAAASYLRAPGETEFRAFKIDVLRIRGGRIAELTTFGAKLFEAFEQYDVAALSKLLHEEATLSMPPYELWLRGPDSIAQWMLSYGIGCKGSRLVPVGFANGMPAFAQYRQGGAQPWAVVLLELDGARIAAVHNFLDAETLFARFGMPRQLS